MICGVGSDIGTEATGAAEPPSAASLAASLEAVSARVVIADADAARRASLIAELADAMPDGTTFVEAATVVEVLAHASSSRMVVVGGAVEKASARSLTQMLARRHPGVHVVTRSR